MIKQSGFSFFLTFLLLTCIWAQTPVSPVKPGQQKPDEDDVVRITTSLVQLDVTVTDKDGKQVTDLRPEDFEILEENRPQQITNFSYIAVSPAPSVDMANVTPPAGAIRNTPPPPNTRLRAAQVRRTIAVLVDDSSMSHGSVGAVQERLKKFVTQAEPNDLVGIFRTARGNSTLQQFTTDQRQLALAVRRLVWIPGAENSVDIFKPERDFEGPEPPRNVGGGSSREEPSGERAKYFGSQSRLPLAIIATRFLINDMRKLPGRKAIMLFSDGLPIRRGEDLSDAGHISRELRLLADYANRSGVVIYTADARGLINTDYLGADQHVGDDTSPGPGTGGSTTRAVTDGVRMRRARELFESHNGLNYLAEETGGTFTRNTNDIDKGFRRALEEQRGYYLIGYRPSDDTFKEGVRSFRKLEVKVKRPGVLVRSRKGFIGIADEVLFPPERPGTVESTLYAALTSPLPATDVAVRLTPIFGQDAKGNSFLRALLHINTENINAVDEANGWKRLTLDVAAVTLGQNGRVVDEFTRTHTVRIGPDTLPLVQQNGLTYTADVPVKSPGAYQFRVVVRDANSKKFGSASQFIEIPDLKKDVLAVSSLVLAEADQQGTLAMPPAVPIEAALSPVQSSSNTAVRRFSIGTSLSYAYLIYNARPATSTRKPQITTQVRLFHEGKEVFVGPESIFDPGQQMETARLSNRGLLRVGPTVATGDYTLQIIVKDQPAGKKPRVATQWIDFEIVK